jgi:hypothetical protein
MLGIAFIDEAHLSEKDETTGNSLDSIHVNCTNLYGEQMNQP